MRECGIDQLIDAAVPMVIGAAEATLIRAVVHFRGVTYETRVAAGSRRIPTCWSRIASSNLSGLGAAVSESGTFADPGRGHGAEPPRLVGRDQELRLIAETLARADGLPQVVLLEGEPGVGKTTLLRAVVDAAYSHGYEGLASAAARSEAGTSFAGLRDLLDDPFDELAAHLPTPQRRALEVALLRREADDQGVPPGTVAAAALGAFRLLAVKAPVMIAIDDLQWLDPSSTAVLLYVLRRLADERVAAVVTVRTERGVRAGLELAAAVAEPRLRRIDIPPLDKRDLERILRDRLRVPLRHAVLARIHEASGGNPFFALELGRALARQELHIPPSAPLPLSPDLQELVGARLAAIPRGAFRVLLVLAALGRASMSTVYTALRTDASDAVDAAVAAGVVEVAGDQLAPAHPILATVAYSLAGPGERRRLHRGLAAVVSEPEGRARHRALGIEGIDPEVANDMELEAQRAFARGAPAAAVELSHQAIRLTPPNLEVSMRRRLAAAAEYTFVAGDTDQALAMFRPLVEVSPSAERAGLLARLARIEHFGADLDKAAATYRRVLAEKQRDPLVDAGAREGLAWCLLLMRDRLAEAAEQAQWAAKAALRGGQRALRAEALAVRALAELLIGQPSAVGTMAEAMELEPATLHLRVMRRPTFAHAYLLTRVDDFDAARSCLRTLMAAASERGDESAEPSLRVHLATVEWLAGDWAAGRQHVAEGIVTARHLGQRPSLAALLSVGAMIEVHSDEGDMGRRMAEDALELAGGWERAPRGGGEVALWALGCSQLIQGDYAGAARLIKRLVEIFWAAGIVEPGELRFLPDYLEALIALRRLDEVETLLADYEATADRLARPSALAASARIRGMLHAQQGDLNRAQEALAASLAIQQALPMPFERARTLLHLGRVQRRHKQRRAAHGTLGEALGMFHQLGAKPWESAGRRELARISGRQPGNDVLTPSERQIAELVAQGLSNKEVAAALFITRKTVETMLQRAYTKLGIHSRTRLSHMLTEENNRQVVSG